MATGPKAEAIRYLEQQAQTKGAQPHKCQIKVSAARTKGPQTVRTLQLVCGDTLIAETEVVCVITDVWEGNPEALPQATA